MNDQQTQLPDNLQLITSTLLPQYLQQVNGIAAKFDALHDAEISTSTFSFYTSVASVFSSKIEGEDIELDSYIKHKGMGIAFQPDYTKKIDDLYNAYLYAQTHEINSGAISEMHKLLGKNIVATNWQGKYRMQNMFVATDDGRIEYVAAQPNAVPSEMEKWHQDLQLLLQMPMQPEAVFYYAAFLHLVFVKIHPWNDGNGRSARLIEKWFIAQKLGEKAWYLQSEKNYYALHQLYYQNLRRLGLEYETLDYTKALPFLLMLPKTFEL